MPDRTTTAPPQAPSQASPRLVLPRGPDAAGAGGPQRRTHTAPAGASAATSAATSASVPSLPSLPAPRVRFVLVPDSAGGLTIHDPTGRRLGAARRDGGGLWPARLRFDLAGRGSAWLEVRAGERWRRSGWVGRTKVFLHDFSADGGHLGAVCVPQGAVRPGAAVLCVEDHRGDLVAEVRRRGSPRAAPGAALAFEVLCGGRPVARLARLDDGRLDVDCGALDPRIVLAVAPFLPSA